MIGEVVVDQRPINTELTEVTVWVLASIIRFIKFNTDPIREYRAVINEAVTRVEAAVVSSFGWVCG